MCRRVREGVPLGARRLGVVVAFAVAASAFVSTALPTSVAARELHIEQFDARIAVEPDGTIEATETIQARFVGAWQGLYRTIPVEYRTPQGLNFTLVLEVVSVTDGRGAALKYEISRERHYRKLKVFLPGAVDARKTIVITYRVANALRFFEDHDELYWNVTGDQWDVPIEGASAHIVLPAGVTGVRATPFTGAFGSRAQDADVQVQPPTVDVRVRRLLGFHEGLTVAVGWDKGFVREPTAFDRAALFFRSNWPLGLPVVALCFMAALWYSRGRDPRLRAIAVRYQPPAGLTPAEAGTLLDDSADMRDITATLVDLAVRGFLVIEEKESTSIIPIFTSPDYVFHLGKSREEWASLKEHERLLLTGIFSDSAKTAVPLSDLQNVFYKQLPVIKVSIFESLMTGRFYVSRPDEVRRHVVIGATLSAVLIVAGGWLASFRLGMSPLPFFIAAAATFAILWAFARIMPARTPQGTKLLEEVLGFEDFLSHVEASRFQQTIKTPEMFEAFLPFAMAFGVEKKWVKAFQTIYVRPGQWYRGPQGPNFRVYDFVGNLNRMTGHVGSALGSAPRSSGGSGFSGGSSGGGSGGGGGGGF